MTTPMSAANALCRRRPEPRRIAHLLELATVLGEAEFQRATNFSSPWTDVVVTHGPPSKRHQAPAVNTG
jgi:hypothetical protein